MCEGGWDALYSATKLVTGALRPALRLRPRRAPGLSTSSMTESGPYFFFRCFFATYLLWCNLRHQLDIERRCSWQLREIRDVMLLGT